MAVLTPSSLSEIGELLHGPRWRRWLAGKLDRTERTVIRYEDGDYPIPRSIRLEILKVVREQREKLEAWEHELSG